MSDDRSFIENDLRITCADAVELVTDFLDDALSPADLDDFRSHLASCEGCRVYVDQVEKTITITSTTRERSVEVRPQNFDALIERLEQRRR